MITIKPHSGTVRFLDNSVDMLTAHRRRDVEGGEFIQLIDVEGADEFMHPIFEDRRLGKVREGLLWMKLGQFHKTQTISCCAARLLTASSRDIDRLDRTSLGGNSAKRE